MIKLNVNRKLFLMSTEKLSTALLKLGTPVIIAMLVTALYSVVDAYFVAGLGTSAMAAVFLAFPIAIIFTGVGLLFGTGGGSYISRLLGTNDNDQANRVASTAVFSSIFSGILLALLTLLFIDEILLFMGATTTILPYAKSYAIVFVIASILTTVNVTMGNLAISQGDSTISLLAMLTGAVLNMLLCPVFIYTLGWGIQGSALATLVAQFATTLFYVWYIVSNKSYSKISFKYFTWEKQIHAQIIKVGISMLILQFFTSLSMGLVNMVASNYGDSAVAAMGIVTRIIALGTYVIFGYIKGFQPVAGYNYGAKNYKRLGDAIHVALLWTTGFCILWTVLIFLFSRPIVEIFTSDMAVITLADLALKANSIMFISFGFQFVYSTLFLALGKAKEGSILTLGRQGIFFIPVVLILPQFFGFTGLIYTQAIADVLTTLLTLSFARTIKKEIKALLY